MAAEQEGVIETTATTQAATASLALQFVDYVSNPIEGINYEIRYANGDRIGAGTSGGLGLTAIYDNLKADMNIVIAVKRDEDGKFKPIRTEHLTAGHQEFMLISPKIKLEAETQKVEGAPGTTDSVQPPVPATIDQLRPSDEAASAPPKPATAAAAPATTYIMQAGDYPGKIAAKYGMTTAQFMALNPQIKDVTKMQVGDVVSVFGTAAPVSASSSTVKPMRSAGVKTTPTITQGRDADGLPMALYVNDIRDWLGRHIAAIYNWRTFQDAQSGKKSTQAHPAINPLSKAPAVTGSAAPTTVALEHLLALIAFEEEHVKYNYGTGTDAVLSKHLKVHDSYRIGSSTFPAGSNEWPAKGSTDSSGRCQVYVNVALAMAGYWNGKNATSAAKESGKDWLAAGFTNVVSELPSVDITMKKKAVLKQPDLVYTCPGDVIVYEEFGTTNPGHVDIRTYHGFGSDYFWKGRQGFPDQSIYKVIGVYRKYSDTLAIARLQAFLRIIRERETGGHPDPYHALHSSKAGVFLTFKDESQHPGGAAAGAYQILESTFDKTICTPMKFWPKTFTPATQDRSAIFLLQFRKETGSHPQRTALGYILQGDIDKALSNTTLNKEWVSLPGGSQSRGFTLDQLKTLFNQYTQTHTKK